MYSNGRASGWGGGEGRIPPDEQDMRTGRYRVASGFDPSNGAPRVEGLGSSRAYVSYRGPEGGSSGLDRSALIGGSSSDGDMAGGSRGWSDQGASVRCQFLRSVGPDGRLMDSQKTAVPTHRCAAFGDPLPLSLRQQELVCLQRVHVSCPRYVRGALLANENPSASPVSQEKKRGGGVPILTIAGVGLVAAAAVILATGFLGFPSLGGGGSASRSPAASASPSRTPRPTPTLSPSPSASTSPSASHSASASLSPTPGASVTWPPGGTASRMDLLVPCPDQTNCWIYTVRGPGQPAGPYPSGNGSGAADTVPNIASFFGVSIDAIYQMNAWARAGIRLGDQLRIPTPTKWS